MHSHTRIIDWIQMNTNIRELFEKHWNETKANRGNWAENRTSRWNVEPRLGTLPRCLWEGQRSFWPMTLSRNPKDSTHRIRSLGRSRLPVLCRESSWRGTSCLTLLPSQSSRLCPQTITHQTKRNTDDSQRHTIENDSVGGRLTNGTGGGRWVVTPRCAVCG